MTPPTPIEALRRIAEAATPGPWSIHGIVQNGHQPITIGPVGARYIVAETTNAVDIGSLLNGKRPYQQFRNAEFIVTFNPSLVLKLLRVVECAKAASDAGLYVGIIETALADLQEKK